MQVELVVFDVAGTTVVDDDHVARALRSSLADVGVTVSERACARVMGLAKPVALEALAAGQVEAHALAGVVLEGHRIFVERMIHHYLASPGVRAVPGAETTFQSLREEGIAIALDTGFSRPILDAILLRLGWHEEVIDISVASDEVEAGRPHPFMIRRAMSAVQVTSAARVIKVGDTPADMREGVAAGAGSVVGVLSGTGTRDDLSEAGATHILADVSALPRLVFGTPRRSPSVLLRDRLFSA